MGLKALVTLDLIDAGSNYREEFYVSLKEKKWIKLAAPETTWKISFNDSSTRSSVSSWVRSCLKEAKSVSYVNNPNETASKVIYAIQMALESIEQGEI
jgi:hypothetical protein